MDYGKYINIYTCVLIRLVNRIMYLKYLTHTVVYEENFELYISYFTI
jgi:hypothetical protein